MSMLIVGLVLMLGTHSAKVVAPGMRDAAVARLGDGPYKGIYSLISLVGLILVVWGFARAWEAPVFLYTPPSWGRHLAMALMIPALILVFASLFPASGIKRFVTHPLLLATMLWALAHLFANGDLAGVVLFGAILVWAVVDRIAQPKEAKTEVTGGAFGKWDVAAVLAGIALYIVLIAGLHYWLFGISPIV
jgi:uncharacterized membrane protein